MRLNAMLSAKKTAISINWQIGKGIYIYLANLPRDMVAVFRRFCRGFFEVKKWGLFRAEIGDRNQP
jgi:SH3-like domain-containing protein